MPSAPPFYSTLCQSGPIECITPGTIQAHKGYSPDLASKITDGLFHPAIEVGLHLLNGDLYSAHFLARKMQNDQYGMWLHGILHRFEGDLTNAKAWYKGLDESMISECPLYQPSTTSNSPSKRSSDPAHHEAFFLIDQVGIAGRGFGAPKLRAQYGDKAIGFPDSAPTEAELEREKERLDKLGQEGKKEVDTRCWEELRWLVDKLVDMYGWEMGVEGTKGYTESTEQQKEISRKMVGGGEGIRKF